MKPVSLDEARMAELDRYMRAQLRPRHLQLLVALDNLRNLGKAAAYLHVTQPAVSKTLAEIERGLGMRLFERTARGVVPTVYGECLIRHARGLLHGLVQAREELRGLASGASARITVGVLPGALPALLPHGLALLAARSPRTNVLLREGTMEALLPQLLLGELDLIVGRLAELSATGDLGVKVFLEEPVVVVAGPRHPLASRRRLQWADLEGYTWVLPPVGSLLREPLERMFEREGVPMPERYVETLSVEFISTYLQLADAIATLARDVASHYTRLGQMTMLKLDFPTLIRPLGITWNRRRPLSPSAQTLIECLEQVAARLRPARRGEAKAAAA
jgi:DNA-binding transcriptional LysR family regulator